jgi:hypothetical protein
MTYKLRGKPVPRTFAPKLRGKPTIRIMPKGAGIGLLRRGGFGFGRP